VFNVLQKSGGTLSLETEQRLADALVKVMDHFLAQYPTSLQTDLYLLNTEGDALSYRSRMALKYRIEEKRTVTDIRARYLERVTELERHHHPSSEPNILDNNSTEQRHVES
jgi:hypothetical protein